MTKPNPKCPDYAAHWETTVERIDPPADQAERIEAEVEAEYQSCEGH